MSEFTLEDDLVHEYLAESREHLATIESDLLAMEDAGAAIDEQLVNRVFRAAHSIKGGAGFFDLTRIRELAHKTENVLDMIRSGQIVPAPDVVNILFLAFDKLSDLISNYATSNEAEISTFVDALTQLSSGNLPDEEKKMLDEPVVLIAGLEKFPDVTALDIEQARRAALSVCVIQFDLLHDIQRRGKTPLDVFKVLMSCGRVLDSAIDLESVGTIEGEPGSIMLDVLYATVIEAIDLSAMLGLPSARIQAVPELKAAPHLRVVAPSRAFVAGAPQVVTALDEQPLLEVAAAESVDGAKRSATAPEATIRLNVSLLDSLMTLAGELVLSRNQLSEALSSGDSRGIASTAHRISVVTSELQETVTQTRMQPVGTLFAKFPRLVRDLAKDLGKDIQLRLEGGDVELDKTILEGLSDPLTHMVRNSVDHGIEDSRSRVAAGKSPAGLIVLRASHKAGQVVIEITDDGKGLSADKIGASATAKGLITAEQLAGMSEREKMALIFHPGVSTAKTVSSVSGRGVGMDVVKTNLDKLGGKIDIDSVPGQGSCFRIKLPLTLAIIPSLLISEGGERFAIPQISVGELIRVPAAAVADRISKAGNAEVLVLRDRLLPLIHFTDILGAPRAHDGVSALNIVLIDTGTFEYGLAVGQLHDTVEIVVKPLGRHLQSIRDYAGATILGDGAVALILDAAGIAERGGVAGAVEGLSARGESADTESAKEAQSLLLFHNGPGETCAVPIELVTRIEKLDQRAVEMIGGRRTMQFEGRSLPLLMLKDVAGVSEPQADQEWVVIVFERSGRPMGLIAAGPLDLTEKQIEVDAVTLRQPGIAGSCVLDGRTVLLVDIFELATGIIAVDQMEMPAPLPDIGKPARTVLIAEDSDFFRTQLLRLVESVGYKAMAASDGQAAWEMLKLHPDEISVVATDIEMPLMDGLALTRKIRADSRFLKLPIIALSSLAGEEEIARGVAAGVTEYQVKLDRDLFLDGLRRAVGASL